MIYSYKELRRWLGAVKRNHRVWRVCDHPMNDEPGVILRHDIDLDLDAAHRLARIERDIGVTSSYFVLLGCPTYNLFTPDNQQRVRDMVEWGFDVGLHFDPAPYGQASDDVLQKHCEREAVILSGITNHPIRSVSIHNPSVCGRYPLFQGFANAYDPRIFNEDIYLSDSRLHFRHNPTTFIDRAVDGPVQILLHPMHYSDEGSGYAHIFETFITQYVNDADNAWRVNSGYCDALPMPLRTHLATAWHNAGTPKGERNG